MTLFIKRRSPTAVWLRVCAAFTLLAMVQCEFIDAPADGATMLMILHVGHTGTHALCEAFARLECVLAECAEMRFDVHELAAFAKRAQVAGKRYAVRMYPTGAAEGHYLEELRGWAARGKLWFLPHVRLELMHYALSSYSGGHPQFYTAAGETVAARLKYDPDQLQKAAEYLEQVWGHQIQSMNSMPHDQTAAIFYEDFLAAQDKDAAGLE